MVTWALISTPRLEVWLSIPLTVDSTVASADTDNPRAFEQHLCPGEPGEDIDAGRLGLGCQPLGEAVERDDVVPVVAKGRGCPG